MSRITYPSGFEQQSALLRNILAKHVADGTTSALSSFLAQQNIDLTGDVNSITDAATHEQSRLLLTRQSQNYCELRDLKFDAIFSDLKGCYQFLKSFYKPNFKALGDWGVPVDTNGKISYPADIIARISLFKAMRSKHISFPVGESPLMPYLNQNNIDLTIQDAAADSALDYHTRFQQAAKAAEVETEKRDLLWMPVNNHIHSIGDYLKKLFSDNAKTLGLWGFVIDSSPRAPKERVSTIKPGDRVTTSGVVLGSTLTNIGKTDLHLYAGKTATGNPVIIQPTQSFGILKGYSIITVNNPSAIEKGQFKVLVVA